MEPSIARAPSRFSSVGHATTTFGTYGRSLGLSEYRVIDVLCVALELVGPAVGGRFLGPNHPIEDDEPCKVAVELIRVAARRS